MPIEMPPPMEGPSSLSVAPSLLPGPPEGLLHDQAQMQQIKSLQTQQQQARLEIQQKQLDLQSQQGMHQAYMDSGGDLDKMAQIAPQYGVSAKDMFGLQEYKTKLLTDKAKLSADQSEAADKAHDSIHLSFGPAFSETRPEIQGPIYNKIRQAGIDRGAWSGDQIPAYSNPENAGLFENSLKTLKWAAQATKDAQSQAEVGKFQAEAHKDTALGNEATAKIAGINTDNDQKKLAATSQQLSAVTDPASYDKLRDASGNPAQFPPSRLLFDANGQWKPGQQLAVQRIGMTSEQRTVADQAAAVLSNTQRHQFSEESTARLTAAVAQGRLAQEVMVNGMKYGPGTQEYWVQQLQQNPDSVKEMPAELRSGVGQKFMAATGLPLPTPLNAAGQTTETANRNAVDNAAWIQNALKNPAIAGQIGPIMGRLGSTEQTVGTAVGLSPQDEALAQELRTRMRYFVFQEGKGIFGGRVPQQLMKQLEASSANPNMDANMLTGALNGAVGAAQTNMDNLDKQRFGGKARPAAMRGQAAPAAAAAAVAPMPAQLSASDVGKTYLNKAGKKLKVTAVNPQNPTQFKYQEMP